MEKKDLIKLIENFSMKIEKEWYGIDCYNEMITNNDNNMFQAEWGGFYFEFLWKNFIKDKDKIFFQKNKNMDFDLFFPENEHQIGDLKTSNENNNFIIGNDYKFLPFVIDNNSIYFIVLIFNDLKDIDCGGIVTEFWNTKINEYKNKKKKKTSYLKRMKNTIYPKELYLLEINTNNKDFLGIFKQGKNSNGKSRNQKFTIEKKNLEHFLLYSKKIT